MGDRMNVSQAIAGLVKAYGAEYAFTLTGGPQSPLMEMQLRHGIRTILGRSERSAFAMADAYARITGKPTFGLAQYGCGTAYLPFAMIDAFWAHSPIVAINSATDSATNNKYEYQEMEQAPLFQNCTKWCGDLPAPDRILDVLRTAIRAAVEGTPGPVYLSFPWTGTASRWATSAKCTQTSRLRTRRSCAPRRCLRTSSAPPLRSRGPSAP